MCPPVDTGQGAEGRRTPSVPPREPERLRLQRNWNEILQELRVTQTGSQIITGFLLTLPFQQRFGDLDAFQVNVYLVLVVIASLTTALALTPVSLHRTLFRRGAKGQLVGAGNLIVEVVLLGVALVLSGTVLLIFDVVVGRTAALIAGGIAVTLMTGAALGFPLLSRRLRIQDEPGRPPPG